MSKTADTDHPIHNTLAVRWSPYVFSGQPVPAADLAAVFEAARWAASSYNEQPWRYIVGVKGRGLTHQRLLECLAEPNQAWARVAPVLAVGICMHNFISSGKPNRAAVHDLGAASTSLVIEATTRGLHVHQMIGIDPEAMRQAFSIPDEAEAYTALAIGYHDAVPGAGDQGLREREAKQRARRPLSEFVFSDRFGKTADL